MLVWKLVSLLNLNFLENFPVEYLSLRVTFKILLYNGQSILVLVKHCISLISSVVYFACDKKIMYLSVTYLLFLLRFHLNVDTIYCTVMRTLSTVSLLWSKGWRANPLTSTRWSKWLCFIHRLIPQEWNIYIYILLAQHYAYDTENPYTKPSQCNIFDPIFFLQCGILTQSFTMIEVKYLEWVTSDRAEIRV